MQNLLYTGSTYAEIAAALGRTREAVHARMVLLRRRGTVLPYKAPWTTRQRHDQAYQVERWEADEDAYIRANYGRVRRPDEPGTYPVITAADISTYLGRTEQAISSRASRLGCPSPNWTRSNRWSEADDARLRKLWTAAAHPTRGCRLSQVQAIAATLGRTVAATRCRATMLGLRCAGRGGWSQTAALTRKEAA